MVDNKIMFQIGKMKSSFCFSLFTRDYLGYLLEINQIEIGTLDFIVYWGCSHEDVIKFINGLAKTLVENKILEVLPTDKTN